MTAERLDIIERALALQERDALEPPYRHIPTGQATIWLTDLIEALRIAREALADIQARYDDEGAFAARDMWRVAYETLDKLGGHRG
jgi:hypothetical protein